jgi:hypothetical protein
MDSDAKLGLLPEPTSRSTIPSSRETPTQPLLRGGVPNSYPPIRSNHHDVDEEQYPRAGFEYQGAMGPITRALHEMSDARSSMFGYFSRDHSHSPYHSPSLPRTSTAYLSYSDGTPPNDIRDSENPHSRNLTQPMFLGPFPYAQGDNPPLVAPRSGCEDERVAEDWNDAYGRLINREWLPPVRQSPYIPELPQPGLPSTRALKAPRRREQGPPRNSEREGLDREKRRLERLHDLRLIVAPEHDPPRQKPEVAVNSTEQVRKETALVETETPLRALKQDINPELSERRASITQSLNRLTLQRRPANEDHENGSSSGTAANTPSSEADDGIIDDENSGDPRSVVPGLPEDTEDLPLSSRTSAAVFRDVRIGFERLLLGLESLDDDDEVELSVTSRDGPDSYTPVPSGEASKPEDACDEDQDRPPEGKQSGSQQPSSSTSTGNGSGDQECDGPEGSGHKHQRIDNVNEDYSRAMIKAKRKKLGPERDQMLLCCFRSDTRYPCLGTDKSICDVIDRLATSHHTFVCKRCYILLIESKSGEKVHPNGVDCIQQCLSPRCVGGTKTAVGPKHRFDARSCGTSTGRPRPEDRESIYRYIFKLVHPTKEIPANVFTTGKIPHLGVIPRQGNRKPNKDELEAQLWGLSEQFEEVRRQGVADKRKIEDLTRDGEMKQAIMTGLEEKVRRLQVIVGETVRPGVLGDEHWYSSIRQRVEMDAPGALKWFPAPPPQNAQTPPRSLHSSQNPSTTPTPNAAETIEHDESFRNVGPQAPDNHAARNKYYPPNPRGNNTAAGLMPELDIGEHARLDAEIDLPAFPNDLNNVYNATTNLELAMNPNAGTEIVPPEPIVPDQLDLNQFDPNQFDPGLFDWNQCAGTADDGEWGFLH